MIFNLFEINTILNSKYQYASTNLTAADYTGGRYFNYTYDDANRLIGVNGQTTAASYAYDGLGDRLQQTVAGQTTTYTLDLNAGLTQVLSDGTNTYLYGNDLLAQQNGADSEYFLGDALGSVRQLTNSYGDVTLARAYDPYGETILNVGSVQTAFGYAGQWGDSSGLMNMRARYYSPLDGRFLTQDSWQGDQNQPMSYNPWLYVYANPVNNIDPSGDITREESKEADAIVQYLAIYQVNIDVDWKDTSYNYWLNDPVDSKISGIRTMCDWDPGLWSLDDLHAVKNGFNIISGGIHALHGNLMDLIGSVKIKREAGNDPHSIPGLIQYSVDNDSYVYKLYAVIHEMGHIVNFNSPQTMRYFMNKLGAKCGGQYGMWQIGPGGLIDCNTVLHKGATYNPGINAGNAPPFAYLPSHYAANGNLEDYAETFREVVVSAYINSPGNGFKSDLSDANNVYNASGMGFNHDIGMRRKVMEAIIDGSWRKLF